MVQVKRKPLSQLTQRQQRNRLHERKRARLTVISLYTSTNIIKNDDVSEKISFHDDTEAISVVSNHSPSHISRSSVASNSITGGLENNCRENTSSDSVSDKTSSLSTDEEGIVTSKASLRTQLADCFIENNINNVQGNSILSVLRSHQCLTSVLPKDVRTLIGTCNRRVELTDVEPGKYWHVGFVAGILKELSKQTVPIPDVLEIDVSTDGATGAKDGSSQYWPIQYRIVNILGSSVLIAGVYQGKGKPKDPNSFFKMFTDEVQQVFENGGICFENRIIGIQFRCFIADAPARAFILNHKGRMSSKPCSKCKVVGSRFGGKTMIFRGTDHRFRTNMEYEQEVDKEHHKDGGSPLTLLGIGRVTHVPYDEMHLVFLGAMRKLIEAGVEDKFKIPAANWTSIKVSVISSRLRGIAKLCPREFSRHPRPISDFKKYKATEFRQFLLYTGPVVLYGVINPDYYLHFLLLHFAIRILSSSFASPENLLFAEKALKLFVTSAEDLYGPAFLSYNIHGLLHLVDDYRRFGALDSISAFPYENNMPLFRKYIRNHHRPLQQFARRLMERDRYIAFNKPTLSLEPKLSGKHNTGPLPANCNPNYRQFSKLKTDKYFFCTDNRNNTVMLENGSLCEICNIIDVQGQEVLVTRKFDTKQNFYDIGRSSSSVGIFKCSNLSVDLELTSVSEVVAKCYRMPSWSATDTDESGDEVVIMTLLHA